MLFLEKIEFNGQIQHILVKAAARSKITYRKKLSYFIIFLLIKKLLLQPFFHNYAVKIV